MGFVLPCIRGSRGFWNAHFPKFISCRLHFRSYDRRWGITSLKDNPCFHCFILPDYSVYNRFYFIFNRCRLSSRLQRGYFTTRPLDTLLKLKIICGVLYKSPPRLMFNRCLEFISQRESEFAIGLFYAVFQL